MYSVWYGRRRLVRHLSRYLKSLSVDLHACAPVPPGAELGEDLPFPARTTGQWPGGVVVHWTPPGWLVYRGAVQRGCAGRGETNIDARAVNAGRNSRRVAAVLGCRYASPGGVFVRCLRAFPRDYTRPRVKSSRASVGTTL